MFDYRRINGGHFWIGRAEAVLAIEESSITAYTDLHDIIPTVFEPLLGVFAAPSAMTEHAGG